MSTTKTTGTIPSVIAEKLSTLTAKERKYFSIMWAKYGEIGRAHV